MITTQNNQIENIMTSTLSKIKNMIDVNTVIGSPLSVGEDTTIIPISKVTLGFMVGGGEYSESNPKKAENLPYAGGSGGGMCLTPVGFLVSKGGDFSLVKIDDASENKWIDLINTAIGVIGRQQ